MSQKIALGLVGLLFLVSCSGGSGSTKSSGSGESALSGSGNRTEPEDNTPLVNTIRNARFVVRQSKNNATFVFVNRAHTMRQTVDGRMQITNGDGGLAYKVIAEKDIDLLLQALDKLNWKSVREPWTAADDQLLRMSGELPNMTGLVLIENNGERWKLAGTRPMGSADPNARTRLQAFTDVKNAVIGSYNSPGITERPAELGRSGEEEFRR